MSQGGEQRVALVTGAAGGIGAALVQRLAADGARVFAADLEERACAEPAAEAWLALDVSVPADWARAAELLRERARRLDVLVNNAGIAQFASIEDTRYEDWRRLQQVNLDGVFLGVQSMLPLLCRSRAAAIVNIGSVSALVGGYNTAAYGAAKAAVAQLTRSIALHCARQRYPVRCNAVHPAFVDSPMLDGLSGGDVRIRDKMRRQIPLGELVQPADVADAVAFLASPQARMITGAALVVDGGLSAGA